MPPEVSMFRSASPENMEDPSIADDLKTNGLDRKNSVAFKEQPGASENKEKERQMIGRADQVLGSRTPCVRLKYADSSQVEQVC